METPVNNERELLQEFRRLSQKACDLITERLPNQAHNFPGEDVLEEARFAYRFLATDPDGETYEEEVGVKKRLEEIKEKIPTLPLQ